MYRTTSTQSELMTPERIRQLERRIEELERRLSRERELFLEEDLRARGLK